MKQNYSVSFPAFNPKCWQIISVFFFLAFTVTNVFGQASIRVGGTVKDNKGAPLSGVSVTIKGAAVGTSTDNAGNFTINVPSTTSVLVFSSVGYIEKSETVGDRKIISVT